MEGDNKTKQYPMQNMLQSSQTYKGTHHIRYVEDFLCNNIRINYKACDLQTLNPNNVQVNQFGSLAERLYKKYTRDRCIRKTSEVTKKSKKVDQNFYNGSDSWINDELVGEEKEAKESTYSDFKSVQIPLAEFYKSLDYKTEVVMQAKRKPEKIQIPEEERMMILGKLKNKQREEQQLRKQLPPQTQQSPPQTQAQPQRQPDQ